MRIFALLLFMLSSTPANADTWNAAATALINDGEIYSRNFFVTIDVPTEEKATALLLQQCEKEHNAPCFISFVYPVQVVLHSLQCPNDIVVTGFGPTKEEAVRLAEKFKIDFGLEDQVCNEVILFAESPSS